MIPVSCRCTALLVRQQCSAIILHVYVPEHKIRYLLKYSRISKVCSIDFPFLINIPLSRLSCPYLPKLPVCKLLNIYRELYKHFDEIIVVNEN